MLTLFAQPYDISACGFYFSTQEEYEEKVRTMRNDFGQPVEEFEIQLIDGENIDCRFARAFGLNQANVFRFMDLAQEWDEDAKRRFIIAVAECGYDFDPDTVTPDDFDIDIYDMNSLKDLAEHFVDEGLFGDIPDRLIHYLDYDAIARDLSADYSEITICGVRLVYRCG